MKSQYAEKLIEKINQSITDIDGFGTVSDLEKSYLAKFLVVFICGIYEEVIENIINERIGKYNHIEVSTYIRTSVGEKFRNPDIAKIMELLGKFNIDWKREIKDLSEEMKTAMNNIVTNKNSLAHGDDVNLTLRDVKQWYGHSLDVINKIDEMLFLDENL